MADVTERNPGAIRGRAASDEFDRLIGSGLSDAEALRETAQQFPDQASLIADFVLHNLATKSVPVDQSDSGADFSVAYDRISAAVATRMRDEASVAGIFAQATKLGIAIDRMVSKLRIGVSLLRKLDQRLIEVGSVPDKLIDALASEMQIGVPQLRQYLLKPPTLAAGTSFKSAKPPRASRSQSFETALAVSHRAGEISESDYRYWRDAAVGQADDDQ